MHQNISILRKALTELGLGFEEINNFPDAVMVNGKAFVRASTPFNPESMSCLCRDKDAVHKLLDGIVQMPKTLSFLDPNGNYEEILRNSRAIPHPRIIKMNQGKKGTNVFLVQNDKESEEALRTIFDKNTKQYDFIALVQEYIEPACEIRVMISGAKPVFAYDRNTATVISKEGLANSDLMGMSKSIIEKIPLFWGALDFIKSKKGEFYFLEVNTKPGFESFVSVHGDEEIKNLYKIAL